MTRLALAGRYVGFFLSLPEGADCGYGSVNIADLREGRVSPVFGRECAVESDFSPFVMTRRGALAWMQTDSVDGGLSLRFCRRCQRGSTTRIHVLDDSRRLRRTSLRRTALGISWLTGSTRRHTRLP